MSASNLVTSVSTLCRCTLEADQSDKFAKFRLHLLIRKLNVVNHMACELRIIKAKYENTKIHTVQSPLPMLKITDQLYTIHHQQVLSGNETWKEIRNIMALDSSINVCYLGVISASGMHIYNVFWQTGHMMWALCLVQLKEIWDNQSEKVLNNSAAECPPSLFFP